MNLTKKELQRGKIAYIVEAALEYLISILVAGSFLAKLTAELGFSDSLTGILSSIISLGCLFQLGSLFIHRRRSKPFVIALSILNQLLFLFLYVTPVIPLGKEAKTAVFIAVIILAYLTYYLAHPKKINWLMSLVGDGERGRFTANKEIVSLIAGTIFSLSMGAVVDAFSEKGEMRSALIVSAIVIFVLTVGHTVSMLLSPEPEGTSERKSSLRENLPRLLRNKDYRRTIVLFLLYYVATYATTPFFGTYQIGELGLSLTLVFVLTNFGSISRICVSRFWGRYADKNSFLKMLLYCFVFLALAFLSTALAVPATGTVAFLLYFIFHGIASGGINSALTNLVFDYTSHEERADALAISQAIAGTVGFLTSLAVSPLVTLIQKSGNRVLGIPIYAQQLLSVISLLVIVGAILYILRTCKREGVSNTSKTAD